MRWLKKIHARRNKKKIDQLIYKMKLSFSYNIQFLQFFFNILFFLWFCCELPPWNKTYFFVLWEKRFHHYKILSKLLRRWVIIDDVHCFRKEKKMKQWIFHHFNLNIFHWRVHIWHMRENAIQYTLSKQFKFQLRVS